MNDIREHIPAGVLSSRDVLRRLASVDIRQVENRTQFDTKQNAASAETWAERVQQVHSAIIRPTE